MPKRLGGPPAATRRPTPTTPRRPRGRSPLAQATPLRPPQRSPSRPQRGRACGARPGGRAEELLRRRRRVGGAVSGGDLLGVADAATVGPQGPAVAGGRACRVEVDGVNSGWPKRGEFI